VKFAMRAQRLLRRLSTSRLAISTVFCNERKSTHSREHDGVVVLHRQRLPSNGDRKRFTLRQQITVTGFDQASQPRAIRMSEARICTWNWLEESTCTRRDYASVPEQGSRRLRDLCDQQAASPRTT
jgi:hypothetical protein